MNTNPEHKTQTQNTEDKSTNTRTQIQEHKAQTPDFPHTHSTKWYSYVIIDNLLYE